MASLKKNIGYQSAYQILNTCLPLITAPYLSRYLGSEMIGVYSYSVSLSGFFVLFAMLGVTNYGTRCIAEVQNQKQLRSKTFCEIYSVQLCSSGVMFLLYLAFCLLYSGEQKLFILIQGIAVFASMLNISWLFFGLEKFRFIVIRSAIIRITGVVLILILVKKPEDLWIYSLIMVGSTLINDAVLWAKVRRLVDFCRPEFSAVKKHFKPMLMLFFPLLAMSVYHLMDKVMLGMLNLFDQGGYYINADKLISIPTNVLTGIGAVLLPRISALRKENKLQEARSLFFLSIEGITAASCAFSFGIAAVANVFVPFFFGPGYDPCIQLTMILAPVLLIKSVSLVMRNAYLIPNRYDRQYIWSVVFGAVCNLIANIILIPLFGAVGASLGTLIAEAAACMWQVVFISRKLPIWGSLAKNLWYVFFGCAMFFAVLSVESAVNMAPVWKLIVEIAIGGAVFCLLCLTYWKISGNPILSIYTANRSNKQENEDSVENERI